MKLDVAVNEVVLSNTGATGEFKIRNSAKAFKILSDGLYSNKIRAIIRELSCNAIDSHMAAGKKGVPFEVHLPSTMEPWFSVRDYGIGLSGDQVVNIYTTYFESTKTDSNDYIGALGLGSKSPFSYTENFTITAIKNGIQRIYSAFINQAGIPCVAEMSEQLTDEGNGVEVKFSVTDRYDYTRFIEEAHTVFKWFTDRPTITGVGFTHTIPKYQEKDIAPGVHIGLSNQGAVAIMGNIAYPLSEKIPGAEEHFGRLTNLLKENLILEFDIGELDFAASREELSFVRLTMDSIKKKLELLNANLATHIAAKADLITHDWDRSMYLSSTFRQSVYKAAVLKYVDDTKFTLFDNSCYNQGYNFAMTVADLKAKGLEIKVFRVSYGTTYTVKETNRYMSGKSILSIEIPIQENAVFVLNDLKTGCIARARFHYGISSKTVYCVTYTPKVNGKVDEVARQLAYDALLLDLHNPLVVEKASSLKVKEKVRTVMSNQGITVCIEKPDIRFYTRPNARYTWVPINGEIDSSKTYYYVALSNAAPVLQDGTQFVGIYELRHNMANSGVPAIENIVVYGVRKSRIAEMVKLSNWVWIEDKLREETAKIGESHIASLVLSDVLDSAELAVYNNSQVAKNLDVTSDYSKYFEKFGKTPRISTDVTHLIELCNKYGNLVTADKVRKDIEDMKMALSRKYPLLQYLKHAEVHEIVNYISMIDKQEKI
jgi:hypothetical protein